MNPHYYIPKLREILTLLSISHASNGGSVLLERNGKGMLNPSAFSTINAWEREPKILQTSFLEVARGGDGGKMGCIILGALLLELLKLPPLERLQRARSLRDYLPPIREQIIEQSLEADKETLIQIGDKRGCDLSSDLADALYMAGGSLHISLEKGEGVGSEVVISDSLYCKLPTLRIEEDIELKGPMFALYGRAVNKMSQVEDALSLMGSFPHRPLIILAPMVGGEALSTIELNRKEGVVDCYALEAPRVTWGRGWLEDFAAFTGATIFEEDIYPEGFTAPLFGSALKILMKRGEIIVDPYDDHAERTAERAEQLLGEADNIPHTHTQDLWKKRAAALLGSLVRVRIGGVTETEARFRRTVAEKALLSMSDALDNGYVERPLSLLYSLTVGDSLLEKALATPLRVASVNRGYYAAEELLGDAALDEPFPLGRLLSLIEKALSIGETLGTIGREIRRFR